MTTVTIDNKEYELDSLSDQAREQLAFIRFCDEKISQLQRDVSIAQTARNTYAAALSESLPKGGVN